jgi:hypothetical protein
LADAKGGVITMPDVKCSVANCEYWSEGNNCHAKSIMIEIDKHAYPNFNEEFATEAYNAEHQDTASNSANTCCQTFELKKQK